MCVCVLLFLRKKQNSFKTFCLHIKSKTKTFVWLNNCHCVKSAQIQSFFWFVFSRIRIEYGEIRSISPYSVWMCENTDQKKRRIWTYFTQWVVCYKVVVIWLQRQSFIVTPTCVSLRMSLVFYWWNVLLLNSELFYQ